MIFMRHAFLTQAAGKYKVITQMGDQGASCDGMRTMREWFEAGLIGDIHTVYNWTNRPVWPQGIPWPDAKPAVPKELKWDLWLGTAQYVDYIENLVPFNWRGWWRFGTGALGDMACHIIGPSFKLLQLGYPYEVTCSATTVYSGIFKEADYPESIPPSSKLRYKFKLKDGRDLKLYWMDGGLVPDRPDGLDADVNENEALADVPEENDFEGGSLFIGTKGKVSCGWGRKSSKIITTFIKQRCKHSKKNIHELKAAWMDIGGNGLMHVLQDMVTQKLILLLKVMLVRLPKLC